MALHAVETASIVSSSLSEMPSCSYAMEAALKTMQARMEYSSHSECA